MKRSLHLGLNVVDASKYNGWNGALTACVFDARDEAVQHARAGFESTAVFNLDATIPRLEKEINEAATKLVAGDTFAMTFSGHGGRSSSWSWSGFTETLCFADSQLSDVALREILAQFKLGVRVIVVLDSCHSFGMVRGMSPAAIRAKPSFVKSEIVLPAMREEIPVLASMLMFTACTAEETAADGERNGAFTASRIAVAEEYERDNRVLTYNDWVKDVQGYMAREHPAQHPQAERYGAPMDWDASFT